MKNLKVTIILKVSDDIDPEDIKLQEDDVIDGYQLTRETYGKEDITSTFKMKSARIESIETINS